MPGQHPELTVDSGRNDHFNVVLAQNLSLWRDDSQGQPSHLRLLVENIRAPAGGPQRCA